jgi:hypothetical protein
MMVTVVFAPMHSAANGKRIWTSRQAQDDCYCLLSASSIYVINYVCILTVHNKDRKKIITIEYVFIYHANERVCVTEREIDSLHDQHLQLHQFCIHKKVNIYLVWIHI